MSRIALYAGSFDPVTNGHVDVVRQGARLADRLVLAIGVHPGKAPLFSADYRLAMLGETCAPIAKAAGSELSPWTFDLLPLPPPCRARAHLLALQTLPAAVDTETPRLVDATQGRIVVKLRNVIALVDAGRINALGRENFYDAGPFHRVIAGVMAQTGDGQNGNGAGGSKYPDLKAEFSNVPFRRGIVGMARKGNSNDSANSQFFIMFAEGSSPNGQYTSIPKALSAH